MTHRARPLAGDDAIRLLCNAVQKIHHREKHDEGISPCCRDSGELMLQDALEYLAYGDTCNARQLMELYESWHETGFAPWPYQAEVRRDHSGPRIEE